LRLAVKCWGRRVWGVGGGGGGGVSRWGGGVPNGCARKKREGALEALASGYEKV